VIDALGAMARDGALPEGLDLGNVTVEPPRDAAHGDMATNAAMVLAKPAGRSRATSPRCWRATWPPTPGSQRRGRGAGVPEPAAGPADLAGPDGAALDKGDEFGRSTLGQGRKVNVEFVSANPTGPMHVGHTRGAVFGDALARLMDFTGHDVTREYYINDGGAQVDVLARSVYLRYLEAHGQEVAFEDGTYPGDYLIRWAGAEGQGRRCVSWDKGEGSLAGPEVREFATEAMMALIREDLALWAWRWTCSIPKSRFTARAGSRRRSTICKAKGLIYEGVLEPPKGKTPEDWEPRVQTLFKSTEYGDDVDRPVMKSDGSWTYFAPDIAYHYDKVSRGFDELIDIFGADHGGYVKRMKAAVARSARGVCRSTSS
jgi:arginyl-tRNA synthetase